MPRSAVLRLQQIAVAAPRDIERVRAGAGHAPLIAHEGLAAVADGAEQCDQSVGLIALHSFAMSDSRPARFERLALVISGAWLAAGIFFATEGQLVAIARGEPVDFPRRPMEIAVGSVVWALFTPVVIWFAAR